MRKWLGAVPAIIGALWVAWLFGVLLAGYGVNLFGSLRFDFDTAARFGDSFGSLSGLMASLAAAGAWYAVHLQKREADASGRERERDEKLRLQAAFEQNFFQLLNQLAAVTRDTEVRTRQSRAGESRSIEHVGKEAFEKILDSIRNSFRYSSPPYFELSYEIAYRDNENDLGHYFRVLYHLCSYVSTVVHVDRQFYMKLVFAQLSNSELLLVGYNCSLGRGRSKFKKIIEEYKCLTNIAFDPEYPREEAILRKYLAAECLPELSLKIRAARRNESGALDISLSDGTATSLTHEVLLGSQLDGLEQIVEVVQFARVHVRHGLLRWVTGPILTADMVKAIAPPDVEQVAS
jgi:hypothetical protein